MSDFPFQLHERLAADTAEIAGWPLCLVRLMLDRTYPWLILVPHRPNLKDLHDLEPADHGLFMNEVSRASRALQALYRPDKINVAALGNAVPQLHIHVIARFTSDPAWPNPVWPNPAGATLLPSPYDPSELEGTSGRLIEALK